MGEVKQKQKQTYIRGIDGLRILSIIGILGYHLSWHSLSGGYLGVLVFFVVSGYLVTRSLMRDWHDSQKIHLKPYYAKRFWRLIPSLVWLFVVTGAFFRVFYPQVLHNFRGTVVSSLFQVNNFWQMAIGSSYFDRFGNSSPFVHLWFLSIEGQFLLVFPLLLGLGLFFSKRKRTITYIVGGLALASALWMVIVYWTTKNVNHVYYGTDTRVFSLFIGAFLALIEEDEELEKRLAQWLPSEHIRQVIGAVATLLMILLMVLINDQSAANYSGVMFLFSVLTMICLWTLSQSQGWFTQVFSWAPFQKIALYSFQLYLWQYPVIEVFNHYITPNSIPLWLGSLCKLLVTFALAAISYHLVEAPLRNGAWRTWLPQEGRRRNVALVGITIISLLFIVGFVTATKGQNPASKEVEERLTKNQEALKQAPTKSGTSQSTSPSAQKSQLEKLADQGYSKKEIAAGKTLKINAIGDSVLLNIAPDLKALFPQMTIDAKVGRQLYESQEPFAKLMKQKANPDAVLIVLGTNGSFQQSALEKLIAQAGANTPVYLLNTNVPETWQTQVNKQLKAAAKKAKNVHVINWQQEAKSQPQWFYEDGVHTNVAGSKVLTRLIATPLFKVAE